MSTGAELLTDAFGRVQEAVHAAVEGLDGEQVTRRIDPAANSIAWLVWHLTRVQDDHVADAAGLEQVWLVEGWAERFGLPFDDRAVGYGQTSEEVGAVQVEDVKLLLDYHDAVHRQTVGYVRGLRDADYDRIVDRSWDPAVSLGVRLVSVLQDTLMHVGQAQYVRGVLEREQESGS
ncbi:DUF664 domain-containing protein [Actinospica durhamensis]|uniref:DUF664 domain-containing protein n=1 Tax=Actinospica durhamensis TaxID=1508375 RepID=A0A941EPQ3_9ACTN|nr:DUF664 domain-containing protein [Actinospica durhamensis]MBR7835030.1 DUF664 domain-containing protein [Actinospica durhamensis]